ncbi:hypothetical protein [Aestuariimicrobium sp. T2.26MG-19.2B]|uniref:hypothetical protein n=1 Tax=Aestuariimicrobium sp. T2.26MG-19.2B TaxID=3040679 RepID=UPI00247796C1|nr:hypothetical protein [Aestuariimicrobium sp. T2.26MG-19.2B]CAI9400434.1 hypothetical protein AESSP_00387 [Aestuariimicrobium sp. T2.26MG-19.2B]
MTVPTSGPQRLLELRTLAQHLEGMRIKLPHLDKLKMVEGWQATSMEPPLPDNILSASPARIRRFATEFLAYHGSSSEGGALHWELQKVLIGAATADLVALIRADADQVIDQLRPAFDEAAGKAREVIGLGVPPEATAETFLDLPVEARDAWKEFRDKHGATLDRVLQIRELLSTALDLPPAVIDGYGNVDTPAINWGVTVTDPPRALPKATHGAGHVRWLQVANDLHLNRVDEVSHTDYIRAAGDTHVDDAIAIARGRFGAA